MNYYKILTSAIAAALLILGFADLQAQQRGQMSNRAADLHTMALVYGNEINLTEQQQAEIARIRVDFRRTMQQQRREFAGRQRGSNRQAQAGNRAALAENRADLHAQIDAVLTQDQRDQLAQIRDERIQSREAQRDLMRTAYIEVVAEDLGFSEETTRQLTEVHANFREEMAPVREAMQRSMRTQAEAGEERQQRQRLQVHREQLNEQIREILTEEEFALWTEEWNQLMPQNRQDMRGRDSRGNNQDRPNRRNNR
ncbi:hypothetical protein CYPRO_0756 [Cyclonatronum proteinivorum]|uniref:LTXXQ motif family protein n=1 Tax=Cyclonatronum proteinivorum TaxID=1457365 RepID=A0A345UHT7_9BACT|nr:hypothetical protein [Cyclonatronum proteinivorum]AXJ00039.1 hypothetical protein CYPRO_0756 [Cyclonatronum proteinivorum]